MALTSLTIQCVVISCSFLFWVTFHFFLLSLKSKWITLLPRKSICLANSTIFACICGFGGWYVWQNPNPAQIQDPLHGENILQECICLIGVGYFIYDIIIVIFIDPTFVYLIHAILGMIFGYVGGVIPLASHAGSFVMSYEISTPFKNIRYFMIKYGYKKLLIFRIIELLFILSFVYLRIVIGFPAMWHVTEYFNAEIYSMQMNLYKNERDIHSFENALFIENIHSYFTIDHWRLYGTYFLLYGGWCNVILNIYWSYVIFKAIVLFNNRDGDYTPDDDQEIIYDESLVNDGCSRSIYFRNVSKKISGTTSLLIKSSKIKVHISTCTQFVHILYTYACVHFFVFGNINFRTEEHYILVSSILETHQKNVAKLWKKIMIKTKNSILIFINNVNQLLIIHAMWE